MSDEILLDYNDSQSAAAFLKQCPVCLKLGTVSIAVDECETPPTKKSRSQEETTECSEAAAESQSTMNQLDQEVAEPTATSTKSLSKLETTASKSSEESSKTEELAAISTKLASKRKKTTSKTTEEDLSMIAAKRKVSKVERAMLYAAFCKQYPKGSRVTRSVVEQWMPGVNELRVDEIMRNKRMEMENAMIIGMEQANVKRQMSILDMIQKPNNN